VSYVNCPRCRLTVRVPIYSPAPEHCPRCEARHGVQERVFLSPTPSRLWTAAQMHPPSGADRAPISTV
jgi:hypothetical protein